MGKLVLFQGDSITDASRIREDCGENCGTGLGYPIFITGRMMADHPEARLRFLNRGISGNRVVDLYARWKIDALNLKPDILSILIGVNDTWHEYERGNGVEVPRYEKIYRMLLDWTNEVLPNTKLVLLEPFVMEFGSAGPGWLTEIRQRAAIVAKLAREYNAVFVPLQQALDEAAAKGAPGDILRDGVHPMPAGHQIIADAWIKATSSLFSK